MDWSAHYPAYMTELETVAEPNDAVKATPQLRKDVEVVDIGCGFGGLLIALAPLMPETLMLGERQFRSNLPIKHLANVLL